jgi:farnesyl-diphosphate farnesyltransferase
MASHGNPGGSFIQEYIPRVSRTFALTIKFLPRELRNSVYSSYLLCRVADTLEDTSSLSSSDKSRRLLELRDLLSESAHGKHVEINAISAIYESINPTNGDDHKLLTESGRLFEILDALPKPHRRIIYKWVAEMAGGMADYSRINGSKKDKIITLKDVEDWNRYCYYVAGTVGHMLTELFMTHYRLDKDVARGLKKLQSSFGLGLQKVNVLKDVPDDRERGACYLPGDILGKYGLSGSSLGDKTESSKITAFVKEIVRMIITHLDDAVEYTSYIPRHLRGVRMFLIVPVYLAAETLALVKSDPVRAMVGPAVKIPRADVARLVTAAGSRTGSNKKLIDFYLELRNKL